MTFAAKWTPSAGFEEGLAPTVTATASSGLEAGVSLCVPQATNFSNAFVRTTYSASMDHKRRDYKFGVSLEVYD